MPTPSALDIQTYNVPSLSSTYVNGWNPTNPSRAETFIAQDASVSIYNESHTRFTARNAEWLFKEMENVAGNTLNCSSTCFPNTNNALITGPTQLCSTATYQIPNLPTGSTVTWTASGLEIVSSNNKQITVKPEGNGLAVITASIATKCGNIEVSTDPIFVGQPNTAGITEVYNDGMGSGSWTLCSNAPGYDNYYNTFSYEIYAIDSEQVPPFTLHYLLRNDDGSIYYQNQLSASSTSGMAFLPNNIPIGFYNLEVWLSGGPCNQAGERNESWIEVKNCGYSPQFAIYPNPTNSSLNIELDSRKEMDKEISLYNDKGTKVRTNTMRKGETKTALDTRDLPNGTYFLHIKEGKETIKRQIIIQH
ncbi:T9SS type A sorting domain-containing protein [Pseudopedobacter saltans]|uniref:T9SS type A sorting domain-containing protein n=1 Tax=Pseudopedobacter saltans TaxID=151895 RepID=UPI0011D227A9|nr:T9SS type A sorting domain-containing protein [Pseudopedobacter saltans]